MKIKKIFITLSVPTYDKLFDYPQNLPIPKIGETVIFDKHSGVVSEVEHIVQDTIAMIKIILKKD